MKARIAIIVALILAAFLAPGFLISPSFAESGSPVPASAPAAASARAQTARQAKAARVQAKAAARQAAAEEKRAAQTRIELQKAQAKLAARQAQLEAEQRAMQKTAESMHRQAVRQAEAMHKAAAKQAAAARKQSEAVSREQQEAEAKAAQAQSEAVERAKRKAEAEAHRAEAKRKEAEEKAEAAARQAEVKHKEAAKQAAAARKLAEKAAFEQRKAAAKVAMLERRRADKSMAAAASSHRGRSVSVHQNNVNTSVSIEDSTGSIKMHADGKFTFNAAENGVASLADGATLQIKTQHNGTTRRAVFSSENGAIQRSYYVNDTAQPFNAETRTWLARVIPEILRVSAINAKTRVARILKQDGPDAVLAEIGKIKSGYSRGVYIRDLANSGSFKPPVVKALIAAAAAIGSSHQKTQALRVIYRTQHPRGVELTALLKAGVGLNSSHDKTRLLRLVSAKMPLDQTTLKTWFGMASSINSDYGMRRAFSALLARQDLTPAITTRIINVAAENMSSDYSLQRLLGQAAAKLGHSSAAVAAYCKAVDHIGSSYGKQQALSALLDDARLHKKGYLNVLNAAAGIASSEARAKVLTKVAARMPHDPELIKRYREVANGITNPSQRERALSGLKTESSEQ